MTSKSLGYPITKIRDMLLDTDVIVGRLRDKKAWGEPTTIDKFVMDTITQILVSITKFSIVIGSPGAYLSRKRRVITWVSDYRCPI